MLYVGVQGWKSANLYGPVLMTLHSEKEKKHKTSPNVNTNRISKSIHTHRTASLSHVAPDQKIQTPALLHPALFISKFVMVVGDLGAPLNIS